MQKSVQHIVLGKMQGEEKRSAGEGALEAGAAARAAGAGAVGTGAGAGAAEAGAVEEAEAAGGGTTRKKTVPQKGF